MPTRGRFSSGYDDGVECIGHRYAAKTGTQLMLLMEN